MLSHFVTLPFFIRPGSLRKKTRFVTCLQVPKAFHKPRTIKQSTMRKLMTRVLENILGSFTVPGVGVGAWTCCVPQMGHIRTPSRSSVPHFLQIIPIISYSYHSMSIPLLARAGHYFSGRPYHEDCIYAIIRPYPCAERPV